MYFKKNRTYFVLCFPEYYAYEDNKVIVKTVTAQYYSILELSERFGERIRHNFYEDAVFPAVCVEPCVYNQSGEQESLLYLIPLERQGMPFDKNRFLFPHERIFSDFSEALDLSKKIQLSYLTHFQEMIQIQNQEMIRVQHEMKEIGKDFVIDGTYDLLYEFCSEGHINTDPNSILFTVIKIIGGIVFKKLVEKIEKGV